MGNLQIKLSENVKDGLKGNFEFKWIPVINWYNIVICAEKQIKKCLFDYLSSHTETFHCIILKLKDTDCLQISLYDVTNDKIVETIDDTIYINIESFTRAHEFKNLENDVDDIYKFIKERVNQYLEDCIMDKNKTQLFHSELILFTDSGQVLKAQSLLNDNENIFSDTNFLRKENVFMPLNSFNLCTQILRCRFENIIDDIIKCDDTSKNYLLIFPMNKEYKCIGKVEFIDENKLENRQRQDEEHFMFILPIGSPININNRIKCAFALKQALISSPLFHYTMCRYNGSLNVELTKFINRNINNDGIPWFKCGCSLINSKVLTRA